MPNFDILLGHLFTVMMMTIILIYLVLTMIDLGMCLVKSISRNY